MEITSILLGITIVSTLILLGVLRKDIEVYLIFNIGVLYLVLAFPFQNGWLAIIGIPMVIIGLILKDRIVWKPYSSLTVHQRIIRNKNLYLLASLLTMGLILLIFY